MLVLEGRPIQPGEGHNAGRQLLAQMFTAATGQPMPAIVTGSRGKPDFVRGGLHFSITHTERHVFCALSDRPIGIDAEETDRKIALGLADKILSAFERAQYDDAADQRLALLKFWVLKEARGKFLGTGLNGYPNHTRFSLQDPRIIEKDGCFVAVIQEEDYAV